MHVHFREECYERKDGPVVNNIVMGGAHASATRKNNSVVTTHSNFFSATRKSIFILPCLFLFGFTVGSVMNLLNTLPHGLVTCTNSRKAKESSSHPEQAIPLSSSYYHGHEKHSKDNGNNSGNDNTGGDNQKKNMIAYLSQGPARSYENLARRFDNIGARNTHKFFYHSFDENCAGCIYQEGTTMANGRNIVLKAAVMSPYWHLFKYIVIFDDDVVLHQRRKALTRRRKTKKSNNSKEEEIAAWQTYHNMLLEDDTDHSILKPRCESFDPKHEALNFQSCVDDNIVALRYDHVDFFYPYSTIGSENFWLNIQSIWIRMERCYPAGVLVDPRWSVQNPEHRYDSGSAVYGNEFDREKVLEILQRDYPTLGPWHIPKDLIFLQRCTVKESPSIGIHPECKIASEQRFENWISGDYKP